MYFSFNFRSRNKRVVDFGILTHPSVYLNKKSKKYGRNAHSCHLRLQQAEIKLYAKFHIVSPRGREFYKGRQASLLVTDVLKNQLRVSDSRIASLDGTLVQGQSSGRTEIQVNITWSTILNICVGCFEKVYITNS